MSACRDCSSARNECRAEMGGRSAGHRSRIGGAAGPSGQGDGGWNFEGNERELRGGPSRTGRLRPIPFALLQFLNDKGTWALYADEMQGRV